MRPVRPKLRPIEVFTVRHGGEDLLCLRDPQGFTDKVVSVSLAAAPLLQALDGRHTLDEIQARIATLTGTTVPRQILETFLEQLDAALLVDSPRFAQHRDGILQAYRGTPLRAAALAGKSYPGKPAALRRMLDGHFAAAAHAGAAPAGTTPRGLVIPHIDLHRGGRTFAAAYQELRHLPDIDTFVILGVAHSGAAERFAGTRKHFATPLGTVETDVEWMDRLASKLPFDLFADELTHRQEHSIEFQAVYLRYLYGERPLRIAPILVGSFHDLLAESREPSRQRHIAAFIRALRETLTESDRRLCLIASVDLAHVGGRFGDEFTVNSAVLEQLAVEDRTMLGMVAAGQAREFYRLIHAEQDRRRVDAWPGVYTLLRVLAPQTGTVLDYDQAHEPDTNSVVTFASLRLD